MVNPDLQESKKDKKLRHNTLLGQLTELEAEITNHQGDEEEEDE
jgi:hypothetical protein